MVLMRMFDLKFFSDSNLLQVQPPRDFTGVPGLCWYQYRHSQFQQAIASFSQAVHAVAPQDPTLRHAVQWGSTYDSLTKLRGTIAFTSLLPETGAALFFSLCSLLFLSFFSFSYSSVHSS